MTTIFMVVGASEPLYEADFSRGGSSMSAAAAAAVGSGGGSSGSSSGGAAGARTASTGDDSGHLHQFIMQSSLDMVEQHQWVQTPNYLRQVDSFNNLAVSAYVTPSHAYFLLLHDQARGDEGIRIFFSEVHEVYVRLLMNPLYQPDTPITSASFDKKIKAAAKRYL